MKFTKSIYVTLFVLLLSVAAFSQSATTLRQKCPSPAVNTYANLTLLASGNISVNPCLNGGTTFSQTTTFTGTVRLNGQTLLLNALLQDGTAGVPSLAFNSSPTTGLYWSANNVIGISTAGVTNVTLGAAANTFRSAEHVFSNVAGTSQFNFDLVPSDTVGTAKLGDCTTTVTSCLDLTQSTNTSNLRGLTISVGDVGVTGNGTALNIVDSTKTFTPVATGSLAIWDDSGILNHKLQRTITAAGTTGAQTINKQAGTVNFAAAATSVVVTNNTVTTSSIVTATMRTADTTCTFIKSVVPTANTITITVNAGCNAETSVGFVVWN